MNAVLRAIEYYLPERVQTSAALAAEFPEWPVGKIEAKTGIAARHLAAEGECASDLAVAAARRLFAAGVEPGALDYLLLCTQSPDYFLPTTACLLQQRLGLPTTTGALDFNLGCSGFVYGLGLAKGLIETGQARNVLLLTAETYSKHLHPRDKSVRTIFGDAAAAVLIRGETGAADGIGPFVYGTDGAGAENLIVRTGGLRHPRREPSTVHVDAAGNVRGDDYLYMNGAEIFTFTLKAVPAVVRSLLERAGLGPGDIDRFVFHQANKYLLESLRQKLQIPADKFVLALDRCGNTVSSTIPIALKQAAEAGQLRAGARVMLVGFGVGYSWGAALLRWPEA